MKTVSVISTYKNGKLVNHKKIPIAQPINPETHQPSKPPTHPDGLIATEAMQHSLHETVKAFDEMASELFTLRKQLLDAERAVVARTKERDNLKRGYLRKVNKVKRLEEQNEDLQARLFAASEDLKHLEATYKVEFIPASQKFEPKKETSTETERKIRSIAANPVKR